MGLSVAMLIKGFRMAKKVAPVVKAFACKECSTMAFVEVVDNKIKISRCRCVQCLWYLLKSNYRKENQMTIEQKMRYKELMWIAKEGDYMSQAEFDELSMLIKLNGYK